MYIENVEKLDALSILDDEVFDELLSIEDNVIQTDKEIELESKAKNLGVKSAFTKKLNARKRDFKRRLKAERQNTIKLQPGTYVTEFSGQEISLECGNWNATDDGIFALSEKGPVFACSHPIYPTGILVNAETSEYKVRLRFKVHNRWREIVENRDVIASSTKIISLASKGVRVTSENAKALVKYLSDVESMNEDVIVESTSTSRLGWINKETFMPYSENVIFDNEQSLKTLYNSIHQCGIREKWINCIKDIRQDRRFEVQVYFAASLASVLVEPCGTLPFIVSLWGGSGKGKTVALMMATSIWADPNEGQYMTDAKATNTAVEIRLDCLNSLPMTLDDMAQIKNQYDEDFSELIYRWCSGKGRDRSNQNLGLNKLTNWRNCTLTNAERSMISETTQGGAVNRVLDIEIEDGRDLFKNGNVISKIFRNNFGFLGSEFVQIVQDIGFDELNKMFDKIVSDLKEIAKNQGGEKEDKQVIPMALILLADKIVEEKVFKDGITIDFEKACSVLKTKGEVSEHKRAYEFIKGMIVSQDFHFADSKYDSLNGNVELYGFWLEENKIAIIGTIFDKILENQGFQAKAFLSWARMNNLIDCDTKGNFKKQIKMNGANVRCVVLKILDFDESDFEAALENIPFD